MSLLLEQEPVVTKKEELTTEHRDRYRNALRNSREEFLASEAVTQMPFQDWLEKVYGVVMLKNDDGYYTMNYDVSDEKRFMMFQIKYLTVS
jgi:hypothetical protein